MINNHVSSSPYLAPVTSVNGQSFALKRVLCVTIGATKQQTINALLTRVNELIDKLMSH